MRRTFTWGVTAVLVGVVAARAGVPSPADPGRTVAAAIRDLGSDDFDTRERAEAALSRVGPPATDALKKAAAGKDPEVAFRAKRLLEDLEWGRFPGAPPEVTALVREYRKSLTKRGGEFTPPSSGQERAELLEGLAKLGKPGADSFRLLAAKTADRPNVNPDAARAEVVRVVRRVVPRFVIDGRPDDAEAVMEAALDVGDPRLAATDYVAFLRDRGTAAAVGKWEAVRTAGAKRPEVAEWVLVNLYRVTGEAAKALDAERRLPAPPTGFRDLYRNVLLADAGRWAELVAPPATTPVVPAANPGVRPRPVGPPTPSVKAIPVAQMVLHKLAGRDKDLDALVREVRDGLPNGAAAYQLDAVVKAFLLAGRPDDAAAVADLPNASPLTRLHLHAARGRYAEAIDFPGGAKAVDALKAARLDDWRAWQSQRGWLLARLGRTAAAAAAFDEVAETITNKPQDMTAAGVLIKAEMAAGHTDRAFDHAAKFAALASGTRPIYSNPLLLALFPGVPPEACVGWWNYVRNGSLVADPRTDGVPYLRRLFEGKLTADEYAKAMAVVDTSAMAAQMAPGLPSPVFVQRKQAHAALARAHGKDAEAEPVLKWLAENTARLGGYTSGRFGLTPNYRAWVTWGDFLADRGRHKEAAAEYLRGWDRFPDAAVLLYLSGRALTAAGDAEAGERRMRDAFRVPLGNETGWGELVAELVTRSAPPVDLRRATDGFRRAAWGIAQTAVIRETVAKAYRAAGMFADAAHTQLVFTYEFTTAAVSFSELREYLTEPLLADVDRGRALLAAGKPGPAAALLRGVNKLMPPSVGVATRVVPEFDRRGAKAEADEFYAATRDTLAAVLRAFPDAAVFHNDTAWLAATCRRDLDTALAHAEKAVAREPENVGYQDTLAEVHFRRGDTAMAVSIGATAAAKTKGTLREPYHRRQLDRFRKGDAASNPDEPE